MSLPSSAIFTYEDGTEVRHFVNIGWFVTDKGIISCVKNCVNHKPNEYETPVPSNWVKVKLYSQEFSKESFQKFVDDYVPPKPLPPIEWDKIQFPRIGKELLDCWYTFEDGWVDKKKFINSVFVDPIAKDLVGVQPMSGNAGSIFTLRFSKGE